LTSLPFCDMIWYMRVWRNWQLCCRCAAPRQIKRGKQRRSDGRISSICEKGDLRRKSPAQRGCHRLIEFAGMAELAALLPMRCTTADQARQAKAQRRENFERMRERRPSSQGSRAARLPQISCICGYGGIGSFAADALPHGRSSEASKGAATGEFRAYARKATFVARVPRSAAATN